MQDRAEQQAQPEQKQVITPATAQRANGWSAADPEGYAVHTGKARSTEDVSVRRGTAPILARGEGAPAPAEGEDEVEEALQDPTLASEGAPD